MPWPAMNTNPSEARFTTKVGVRDGSDVADPWDNEPIYLNGGEKQMIGRAASGAYGYTTGKSDAHREDSTPRPQGRGDLI